MLTFLSVRRSLPSLASGLCTMQASLPRDVRDFLDDYPDIDSDDEPARANLEFYSNKRRCQPDNVLVNEIHKS